MRLITRKEQQAMKDHGKCVNKQAKEIIQNVIFKIETDIETRKKSDKKKRIMFDMIIKLILISHEHNEEIINEIKRILYYDK